jgi:hypothetical protein
MSGKELTFTKGYNQDELNAWWAARGLPGAALTVPDFLSGKTVGGGRDAYGIFDIANGGKRIDRSSLTPDQYAQAMKFRNDLGSFTDPYRQQSGASRVAGGILDVASVALPYLGIMRTVANAGNNALGNNDPPDAEGILASNHAANGLPGEGHDVLGTGTAGSGAPGRHQTPLTGDYKRYGMGPEHAFYAPGVLAPSPEVGVAPPTHIPPMADGGALKQYPLRPRGQPSQQLRNFSNLPGMSDPRVRIAVGDRKTPTQFVSHGTGAGGRDDNIDAKLSENEYVIDAETVALLGDGSPEAGAHKLDAMREGIRKHKGQALARGKISPDAKSSPLQYLAEGGKVGALAALFKRKPPVDPNAGLRRIKAQLDASLVRSPVPPLRRATPEELDQDVLDLRREVGPQGGDTRPLNRARGGALTVFRGGRQS